VIAVLVAGRRRRLSTDSGLYHSTVGTWGGERLAPKVGDGAHSRVIGLR
jgi:hypothetical protein